MSERIAVIGLGYVGLPVAVAFAEVFPETIGFDISERRVGELRDGVDGTGEVDAAALQESSVVFTTDREMLKKATFFVVAVPTPIDINRAPDLGPLKLASELVGEAIGPRAVVVFESTVYPGVTEVFCGPIIERISGLRHPHDFALGYSPERANPGDREHSLQRIVNRVIDLIDGTRLRRIGCRWKCEICIAANLAQDCDFVVDAAPSPVGTCVIECPIAVNEPKCHLAVAIAA